MYKLTLKESEEYLHFRRVSSKYGKNCGLLGESAHLSNGHGGNIDLGENCET